MGDTGGSYSGSQGVKSTKAAKIAAVVQAAPQPQAGPPTGANGFGHLTPQQVSTMESAAQRQMMRDPALAAGVTDYINPVMQSNGKALSQNANWAAATGQPLTKRQQQMLDAADKLAAAMLRHTSTFGVRKTLCQRYMLSRSFEQVQTPYGAVRIKTGQGYGAKKSKPEYEDLARIAREQGISLAEARALLK